MTAAIIILQCTGPGCCNARPMTERDMTAIIVYCERCGALMLPYRIQELKPPQAVEVEENNHVG